MARLRRWEDGPKLPGIGIAFDAETVPRNLGQVVITRLAADFLTV
jgi:hypothetical protein